MAKIVRLTESDLVNLVKKVIKEQETGGDADDQITKLCNECRGNSQIKITQRSNQIADKINDAIEDLGTDFDGLVSALKSIQNFTELCAVVKSYDSSYDETFEEAIDSDVDGDDLTMIYRIMRDLKLRR